MDRRRLALVFGNDRYPKNKLNSCRKDAKDVSAKLKELGFHCTVYLDQNKRQMDIAIRDFCAIILNDDCVLVYFSGHGMEAKGKNYLVPIENIQDPEFDCINLEELLKQLNNCGDNLLNIIILDACRADQENDTWKTKATSAENEHTLKPAFGKALSGHVRLPNQSQFVLIYSADPGTVSFAAGPHTNGNSFFTYSLLNHISTSNIKLEDMLKEVSKEIKLKSQRRQRPWLHSCLDEDFFFKRKGQSALVNHININTKWTQHGITIAGGNGQGNQLNQLDGPEGIYVDDDHQTIYIADWGNHRIVEWKYGAKNGQVVAGGNGNGNGSDQLSFPTNVIVDKKNDSLIICDKGNRRVVRWSCQNGRNGETIISDIDCWGLTMDNNGDFYVTDYWKSEVRRWKQGDTEGTIVAGGNGQGNHLNQLHHPTYIFVDEHHSVYVSDITNHRVIKWMKGAKEGIVVAGRKGRGNGLTQLSFPRGVIVNHLGNVYVTDYGNHRIMRWCKRSCEGSIVVGGNGEGKQLNQFYRPTGLSFDVQGSLYVVDEEPDIGDLEVVEIEHNGESLADSWFLDDITIEMPTKGRAFYFACHEWLSKEKVISYEVTFYTCDVSHAGTGANVSLILYGTLDNIGIRGSKQKGELTKLHIEHDSSMISPDWFLDKVEVINMNTNETISFSCNRWLGKRHDDHEIQRDLLPMKIS
ncbi:unnamed protein product [Adineta steineri]|uniref:Uncharacterized protein n=1 Tax=Adineta steineri TaxID=433720 RepID=A0A814WYA8_9BILA|nr:unnamed protein product [Adineta steineri]CAF1485490.1 unnamed protein product [Adineta steineri]